MYLLAQETCPRPDDIRFIPLTKGQFAAISAFRYDWAMRYEWRAQWNPCTRSFYAYRSEYLGKIDGKYKSLAVSMAREILGLDFGKALIADHINHDTLCNTDDNLRAVTRAQSMQNQRCKRSGKSAYKGVFWQKWRKSETNGKWCATITTNRKRRFLGYFSTELEAYEAYCTAAREVHGEFACTEGAWPPRS